MSAETNKNLNKRFLLTIFVVAIAIVGIALIFFRYRKPSSVPPVGTGLTKPKETSSEIKKFASEQEYKDYLEKAKNVSGSYFGRGAGGPGFAEAQSNNLSKALPAASLSAGPSRVSETNVQVAGIDEPDAVKTDGKEIFFSSERPNVLPLAARPAICAEGQAGCAIPSQPERTGGTKSIKAFPPENLNLDSKIERNGDLLLAGPPAGEAGKTLIIIPSARYYWDQNANKIYGYDVSNPARPKEIWNIELKKTTSIAGARLANGKIYLIIKTTLGPESPCLMKPLAISGADFSIKCTDIFHPVAAVPAEATFTAMIVDPSTGSIEKNTSFLASDDMSSSIAYMSSDALYLTYYNPGDAVKILYSFFSENNDLAPDWLVQKLKNLENYDISSSAKMTEVWELVGRFQNSLSADDQLKMQNELANRAADYITKHLRDLDSTGIVKMNIRDLNIEATGNVPGKILNQFSLDDFNGNLRMATTVGENMPSVGFGLPVGEAGFRAGNSSNSANDVYILGDGLKTEGSVIDLGKGERIFSVRFIGDKGYVVTFKQTDPFYVLDLADPMNPAKKGEMKIPGFSSYLHPVGQNRILGVGEENNQVKISLFDVSDPADPTEISKYNLDEYWSEISQTHHAFLLDAKHSVFFLPGSKGGYIFSYAGDELKLAKAVSDIQAKRAIYIDNFLYVIGEDKLVILDENNWGKVNELDI